MRRERGNNSVLEGDSPAETALIWLIGPAVLLYGAYLLAGFLAGRIHCGAPTKPDSLFAPLGFLVGEHDPAATEVGDEAARPRARPRAGQVHHVGQARQRRREPDLIDGAEPEKVVHGHAHAHGDERGGDQPDQARVAQVACHGADLGARADRRLRAEVALLRQQDGGGDG